MSITRKRGLRALVAGAAMALLLGPGGIAQAEVVEVDFPLSAALVLGTLDIDIEGVNLVGDWDDETGDFTDGVLTIPDQALEVESDLGTADVAVSFTVGTVAGTVPPDGSEGEVTSSVDVSIGIAVAGDPIGACTIPTFNLALVTELIVDLEADTIDLVAIDDSFSVGAATCDGPLAAVLTPLVNTEVGLPDGEAFICLATDLDLCGPIPDVEPDPTPAPTPAPVTPAEARPAFTG